MASKIKNELTDKLFECILSRLRTELLFQLDYLWFFSAQEVIIIHFLLHMILNCVQLILGSLYAFLASFLSAIAIYFTCSCHFCSPPEMSLSLHKIGISFGIEDIPITDTIFNMFAPKIFPTDMPWCFLFRRNLLKLWCKGIKNNGNMQVL